MEYFSPPERPSKTQAFRANIYEQTSPPRVRTDPDPPSKKPPLHGLHHHHKHHHRHHSRHAKDAVQSAIQLQPPTSFGDLLKQASKSSRNSSDQSRRESVANPDQDTEIAVPPPKPKPVRPEDVTRERARVKAREDELRSSLQDLSERSLRSSRRLDDTYYSILEKVSVLRQTIGSLQELSTLTKELHENFETDTQRLAEDIEGHFEGFHNFETQQQQMEGLEQRINAGREKAEALTARLSEVKTRVEARAKLEAEWEAKTTRRLRVFWGILGIVVGIVIIAILFQQLKSVQLDAPSPDLNFASRNDIVDAPIPDFAKEEILEGSTKAVRLSSWETSATKSTSSVEDDKNLRMFDEL